MKLKRKKGRNQCRINCHPECGPGRNVATATVWETSWGEPIFFPIRKVWKNSVMGTQEYVPICNPCARLWYARWKKDTGGVYGNQSEE